MAEERYDRHDILAIPDLTPKRSYESDGIVQAPGLQTPIQKPVRELKVIDDLDELTSLADLLPPEIGDIIRDINKVLSEDSQGKLIIAIEQGGFPPPITIIPPSTPPEGIGPVNFPPISGGPGSETWGPGTGLPSNGGGEIDGPGSETWEPGTGLPGSIGGGTEGPEGEMGGPGTSSPGSGGSTSGGPGSGTEHPGTWPSEQEGSGGGGPGSETKGPGIETKGYGTSHPTDGTWIIGGQHEPNDGDYDVDDIFSAPPTFTVELEPTDSLVDLARKAYRDDDLDIKADYVAKMTQNIARFYQVMSTLAVDGGMPDYSYLMREFDGTAVSTSDANQRHLIDYICKNQIIYDQRLRQMNLTHTAENTLVMTRGFSAAEAQRERYFGEKFKANMNDTASTLSNDILEKERQNANKKYKEAAYNMYKYLDSAAKYTNALLNIRIDEAAAKVQLSNTGSDIYAITPPPPPTADNIDDGFETTQKQTEIGEKYVEEAQKDSVMGYQASGGGASYSGGGNYTSNTNIPSVGIAPGKGVENIPKGQSPEWAVNMCIRCSKGCGIPADWIYAQFRNESGNFERPCAQHNYGGMSSTSGGWMTFNTPDDFADYMAKVLPRWVGSDGKSTTQAKTMLEYAIALQTDSSPYCAEPAGVEPYYAAMLNCLGNQGTVLT